MLSFRDLVLVAAVVALVVWALSRRKAGCGCGPKVSADPRAMPAQRRAGGCIGGMPCPGGR